MLLIELEETHAHLTQQFLDLCTAWHVHRQSQQ